jgi:hypothetical protein
MRVPTSVILGELARDAPVDGVTLAWVVAHLRERSFGIVMLLVAVIGLVPGTSLFVGVLLAVPAVQMMLGREEPVLPRRIAARRVATARFVRLLAHAIPVFARLETFVRPRWTTPFGVTRRVVGTVVLLLGLTLLAPIPFSQYPPVLVIMLLAFAYLEEDGVLLAIGMVAAALSLAVTAAAVWGMVEAGLLL